ncbi:uncharacterized protein LY89DRAFT_682952 [Mollisia scopiformis]|uniref:Uncharacterized protein n=1 Tax=Mollisia scopiformis TaxID=149040 RepID=A0A194XIV7_MOLSC|nr:uncharacterized protein LY89DRAFT_682952 [Mollisia scopiformis]KUJ20170.1 hypothetical protein LY89DRAFT_682952 [Mollisia scopiformis]
MAPSGTAEGRKESWGWRLAGAESMAESVLCGWTGSYWVGFSCRVWGFIGSFVGGFILGVSSLGWMSTIAGSGEWECGCGFVAQVRGIGEVGRSKFLAQVTIQLKLRGLS